jgi:hypothetical protein
MKTIVTLLVLLALVTPAAAADPPAQTFAAPIDRVWSVTLAVLKSLGWGIETADRSIGWITTESRRLEGEDYAVYAKGTRHKLVVRVKEAPSNRTTVNVERTVFKRERILWIDKDEPLTTTDQTVEKSLLDAIGKSL